jgi:hypothetical protein
MVPPSVCSEGGTSSRRAQSGADSSLSPNGLRAASAFTWSIAARPWAPSSVNAGAFKKCSRRVRVTACEVRTNDFRRSACGTSADGIGGSSERSSSRRISNVSQPYSGGLYLCSSVSCVSKASLCQQSKRTSRGLRAGHDGSKGEGEGRSLVPFLLPLDEVPHLRILGLAEEAPAEPVQRLHLLDIAAGVWCLAEVEIEEARRLCGGNELPHLGRVRLGRG